MLGVKKTVKMRPRNLIFLGPPGSGKSTQAEIFSRRLAMPWLSMGRTLRQFSTQKTPASKKIAAKINHGLLVSDQVIDRVLRQSLAAGDMSRGIIFEGVPRSLTQWRILKKILVDFQLDSPVVFNLNISEQESFQRISHRRKSATTDLRSDDTDQKLKQRIAWTKSETQPLIDQFRQNGRLYDIDGEQPVTQVTTEIETIIDRMKLRDT